MDSTDVRGVPADMHLGFLVIVSRKRKYELVVFDVNVFDFRNDLI